MRSISAAAVLALTLTLTACGGDDVQDKAAEKIAESVDGVNDVDVDGDKVTIETDEGTISTGEGTELPDSFPEDVPMPSAEHIITSAVEQGDEIAVMLTAPGDFDFDAEKSAMEAALTEAGYSIDDQSRSSASGMEMFSINASLDGTQVSITAVSGGDEGVALMYAISPATP